MALFHPRPEDLPKEFAVFPLNGALLLPRSKLPLNIFEQRYLNMTHDALASGRMFGMIQSDPHAATSERGPGLYRVGCLGRLSSFSETDDGRLLISLNGLIRFTIDHELDLHHGYRRVRADFSHYLDDLNLERPPVEIEREKILAALRAYFARLQLEANWDAIRGLTDDALVITLTMACPFEAVEKQALLEAQTDTDRAATLLTLLQMGAAGSDPSPGHAVS